LRFAVLDILPTILTADSVVETADLDRLAPINVRAGMSLGIRSPTEYPIFGMPMRRPRSYPTVF